MDRFFNARIMLPVVLATAFAAPSCASTRGQSSYTLPEAETLQPISVLRVRKPLWSHTVDSDPSIADPTKGLAIGEKVVAFSFHGRVCGFTIDTGAQKWCAGFGSGPAYAGQEFAYTDKDGVVRAVDSATGLPKWNYSFPLRPQVTDRSAPRELAWAARDDFLIARINDPNGRAPDYGEVSNGHLLWRSQVAGYYYYYGPVVLGPYAIQPFSPAGPHANNDLEIIRLGDHGGVLSFIGGGGWVVGGQSPVVFISNLWHGRAPANVGLTFEIRSVNLKSGILGPVLHYEPDYSQNYERIKNTFDWMRGPTRAGVAKVEAGFIYGLVAGRLYRYALADGNGQHPLLIPGDYLGAPTHGIIYVSRSDGIWALRIGSALIHAQRITAITPRQAMVTTLATFGDITYIGFSDGRFLGVSTNDGRTVLEAQICPAMQAKADARHIYVLCTYPGAWKIFVFPRLDARLPRA